MYNFITHLLDKMMIFKVAPAASSPEQQSPGPPLRGRNDRMRVAKMSGKGVLFVRQSPA